MQPAQFQTQPPAPERRRFNGVAAVVLAFFSADLYRDVARRWRGIGFWHLALLMLIAWVPVCVKIQMGFSKFVRDDAPRFINTFPTIHINKGVVSIDEPEPYLWRDPDSKKVFVYVDTEGKFDLPEGKDAFAKLSKSKLEYRQNDNDLSTRVQDLSQIQSFNLDKNDVSRYLQIFAKWLGVIIFIFGFVFSLIGHLIQVLIYALIGMIFASMFNARLSYAALMRLAVVALTPAIILGLALELTNAEFRGVNLVYIIIEMLFLGFAVKANASDVTAPPPGFPGYGYAPPGQYPAPGGYTPPGGYAPPPTGYAPPPAGYAPPPPGYAPPPPQPGFAPQPPVRHPPLPPSTPPSM